jgi:hypothetical protein
MQARNHRKLIYSFILIVMIICIVSVVLFFFLVTSPSNQAKEAVETFYSYEQDGNFAESWKMFHPFVKERLEKNNYLEDRVHLLFNDFGVHSFTFSVEDPELIRDWQMDEETDPIDEVYRTEVRQYFEGVFGNLEIVQSVYVTNLDGEWTVLWDYKKSDTFLETDEN